MSGKRGLFGVKTAKNGSEHIKNLPSVAAESKNGRAAAENGRAAVENGQF